MERSAQLLVGPAKSPRSIFYDISRAGMHPGEPENRKVWPNGDRRRFVAGSLGNVTRGSEFAIPAQMAIIRR